jgi:TRAP-type C4-dicarboxylate transport system permease small subunit
MQVFYYSIPVGMILMIIRLIERTIKRFLHKKSAQEGGLAS